VTQILAIRHVAFEDLGLLEPMLKRRGHAVRTIEAGIDSLAKIDPDEPELLICLGGPIGANDEEAYPWLADELALIKKRIEDKRPVLGICLGAQLIAKALGARVYPGTAKEIGFGTLSLSGPGYESCLLPLCVSDQPVLHWHGDTFDVPEGATLLASTSVTPHQAFSYGDHVLALQFHLEVDLTKIERWLVGHAVEISAAQISVPHLRAESVRLREGLKVAAEDVFGRFLSRIDL
jgi:GMP synthase (glutamine-hydrolysing)